MHITFCRDHCKKMTQINYEFCYIRIFTQNGINSITVLTKSAVNFSADH